MFVSFDPNIRPFFLDDPEAAWRDVVALAAGPACVKLSDEDLRLLRPGDSEEDVCRGLLAGEPHRAGGADPRRPRRGAFTEGATLDVKAPPTQVVDTVGAGDSFMAAMLAMLIDWGVVADGEGRWRRSTTPASSCWCAGRPQAAAMTCSRRGANPPTLRELPPTWPAG